MIIIIIAQEIILLYKSIFYIGCLRKKVVCSIELFTPRSEQSASSKKRRTTSSSGFAPDQFPDNIDLEDLIDNLWCSWPLGQYLGYPWGHLATSKNLVTFMLPWEYFSTGWSGSKYDEGIHPSEKSDLIDNLRCLWLLGQCTHGVIQRFLHVCHSESVRERSTPYQSIDWCIEHTVTVYCNISV